MSCNPMFAASATFQKLEKCNNAPLITFPSSQIVPKSSESSNIAAYANMNSKTISHANCAVPSFTPSSLSSLRSMYHPTFMFVTLWLTSMAPAPVKSNVTTMFASCFKLALYVTACAVIDRVMESKYKPSFKYCNMFPRLFRVAAMSKNTGNPSGNPGTFLWKKPYGVPMASGSSSLYTGRNFPEACEVL